MAVEAPPAPAPVAPVATPPAPVITPPVPVTPPTPPAPPIAKTETPPTPPAPPADPTSIWDAKPAVEPAKTETPPIKTEAKAPAEPVYAIATPEWVPAENKPLFDAEKDRFIAVAKESKLSPEQASALFTKQVDAARVAQDRMVAADMEACKADPDFGGAKFNQSLEYAKRALVRWGGVQDRATIETSLQRNNPVLFRILARAGAELREDGHLVGGPPVAAPADPVRTLYPGDGKGPKRT